MIYEIKANLKSRISIFCCLVLLILNILGMINLERKYSNYYKDELRNLKHSNIYAKNVLNGERRTLNGIGTSAEEMEIWENYFKQKEWTIGEIDKLIEIIEQYVSKENKIDEKIFNKEQIYFYINTVLMRSKCYSTSENRLPLLEKTYEDEIAKHKDKINIDNYPFDPYKLRLIEALSLRPLGKERIIKSYESDSKYLEYYFYLLDKKIPELDKNKANPWTFLSTQLSMDSPMAILIIMVSLFYTISMIIYRKRSNSIKLLSLQSFTRNKIIIKQIIGIMFSYFIIVIISFFIPFLILGTLHGFSGINYPILVHGDGYVNFETYSPRYDRNTLGLSNYYSSVKYEQGVISSAIPKELSFYPLYKVLCLTIFLFINKLLFYVVIGVLISMFIDNNFILGLTGTIIMGIFILSQGRLFKNIKSVNPFAVEGCWETVVGNSDITYLNSMLILFVGSIFLLYLMVNQFSKKDIQ